MTITLHIEPRDTTSDAAALRTAGMLPVVVYGKQTPSTSLSVSLKDFTKIWKEAGESSVITLSGAAASYDVLIHEVAVEPVSDTPIHVDFYAFEKGKKIEVAIPLEFVGTSPAVKDLGGNLVKVLHEIKIAADPQNLPREIAVDISPLTTFDSVIVAGDITLPHGVELIENGDEVVASIAAPQEEVVEEAAPVDLSAIEVAKKGKKEEEAPAAE